jgi:hypothetical protein
MIGGLPWSLWTMSVADVRDEEAKWQDGFDPWSSNT